MTCVALGLSVAAPAPAEAAAKITQLGPVLTRDETPTVTMGRDGGFGVPLPNGKDFWVFGDSPRFQWAGQWKLKYFIDGSTAAEGPYARWHVPKSMDEVRIGHPLAGKNAAAQLIPSPTKIYFPDGSGRLCTRRNGAAENGRWPTGAVLLPDKTNVLITYLDVCVVSYGHFAAEGWGFAEYSWRSNRLSVRPTDVFPPARSGASLGHAQLYGSPVISNRHVTMFSDGCCTADAIYRVTIAANVGALASRHSYVRHAIPSLRHAVNGQLNIMVASYARPHFRLLEPTDTRGDFNVFSAPAITGPWAKETSGTLPGCRTSPGPCYQLIGHPELSTSTRLIVSYYLPGYGPGVRGHTVHRLPINHLVLASIAVK